MPHSIIEWAIAALMVLYVALMVVFGVLVVTGSVDPLPAGILGLTACAIAVCWHLLRRWNRQRTPSRAR